MDHVLLITNTFIQEHPDQLQELIDQLVRGSQFIETHPHEAAQMGEDYTGSSAAVFEQVLTDPPDWISFNDYQVKKNDLEKMAGYMVDMGLLSSVPDDLDSAYTDMRFVNKSLSTGGGH